MQAFGDLLLLARKKFLKNELDFLWFWHLNICVTSLWYETLRSDILLDVKSCHDVDIQK